METDRSAACTVPANFHVRALILYVNISRAWCRYSVGDHAVTDAHLLWLFWRGQLGRPVRREDKVAEVQTDAHKLGGPCTVRVELIGHFQPCMTEISLHIGARMADYIRTHPY